MDFFAYPKIPGDSSSWRGDLNRKGLKFGCFEKVHGSNFSVRVDAQERVSYATRRRVLEPGEDFFHFRASGLHKDISEKAIRVLQALKPLGVEGVAVFGELCGGHYQDEPVPANVEKVQIGVDYCPFLAFLPFDVAVVLPLPGPLSSATSSPAPSTAVQGRSAWGFLDVLDAIKLCAAAGFLPLQPLTTGDFAHCVHYPLGFDSTVPSALGLTPPPKGTNKAEGVVIRLLTDDGRYHVQWQEGKASEEEAKGGEGAASAPGPGPRPLRILARDPVPQRMLLKQKIPEFNDVKYLTRSKPKKKKAGPGPYGSDAEAREMAALAWSEGIASVTPVRLQAAISKIGRLTREEQRWRNVLREFICDSISDAETRGVVWKIVRSKTRRQIQSTMRDLCVDLMNEHLKDDEK